MPGGETHSKQPAHNPYTLMFGYPPVEVIERTSQTEQIIDTFCREQPASYANLVTGIRGSGKTVFITLVADRLKKRKDWIVVNLNARRDLLLNLASKLDSDRTLHKWFRDAEINLQAFGIGVAIKGIPPITDIEEALTQMLISLKKHNKRLLITVDEVTNSADMRVFASAYQIFLRERLPVFLLMTGLFRDIHNLRNAPGMTFLERAPRTLLSPLSPDAIADNYSENLNLKMSDAMRFAKMTKGYSFAFQVLGYFLFENPDDHDRALQDTKAYLYEFAYEKIWSETSEKDRDLIFALAEVPTGEVKKIRGKLNYSTNQFNPYRDRLIKLGLLSSPQNGLLEFALPFYDSFALKMRQQ